MQAREAMDHSDAVDQATDESRLRVTVPAAVDGAVMSAFIRGTKPLAAS